MLNIRFSKLSKKFIERIPPKHRRQVVEKSISLKSDPLPSDSKLLKGFPGYFRVDIGEYRIIYTILEPRITIELVGKRNDNEVYRRFKRLM